LKATNLSLNREITEKRRKENIFTVIYFVENTAKDCPQLSNAYLFLEK